MNATAYGIIKVKAISGHRANEPLQLTFTNEDEFEKTRSFIRSNRRDLEIMDAFFGYQINTSLEAAIETLNVWLPAR